MNYDKAQPELDLLVRIIERHPEGISAEEILAASKLGLQRRSFQRRLSVLVEAGRIRAEGKTRGVRYFPARGEPAAETVANKPTEAETYVPISAEGEAIKAYVRQPRHLRKPAVYRTEFLEQYHPNHTAYLPLKLREQLHGIVSENGK